MDLAGKGWSKPMRGAKGEDGKPCERCGQPAHSILMAGVPSPGGLTYQGQLRLCDPCAEEILQGDKSVLQLLEERDRGQE
jgi:hypothetical protein